MLENARRIPEFSDGDIVSRRDFAGIILGEVHYPAQKMRPVHSHERACFHFLLEGGYTEYQGRHSNECKSLSLSFQPSGHEHSYRCSGTVSKSFTMEVEPDWLALLADHSLTLNTVSNFRSGLILWLLTRLYNEFCAKGPATELMVEALALEIAVEVSRRQTTPYERKGPLWLKQAAEMLDERFAESLTLREIARTVGIHPVHLARTFRQHYGCTVGDYVRKLRIEFACKQVVHSDMSLPEIALAAGFSDQSQFTRMFKRTMGITPGSFRDSTRRR